MEVAVVIVKMLRYCEKTLLRRVAPK